MAPIAVAKKVANKHAGRCVISNVCSCCSDEGARRAHGGAGRGAWCGATCGGQGRGAAGSTEARPGWRASGIDRGAAGAACRGAAGAACRGADRAPTDGFSRRKLQQRVFAPLKAAKTPNLPCRLPLAARNQTWVPLRRENDHSRAEAHHSWDDIRMQADSGELASRLTATGRWIGDGDARDLGRPRRNTARASCGYSI